MWLVISSKDIFEKSKNTRDTFLLSLNLKGKKLGIWKHWKSYFLVIISLLMNKHIFLFFRVAFYYTIGKEYLKKTNIITPGQEGTGFYSIHYMLNIANYILWFLFSETIMLFFHFLPPFPNKTCYIPLLCFFYVIFDLMENDFDLIYTLSPCKNAYGIKH